MPLKRILSVWLTAAILFAPGAMAESRPRKWRQWWIVSGIALIGATLLDAQTSYGRWERNPLLKDAEGRFATGRGLAMKSGFSGGMLLMQFLVNRNGGRYYKLCSVANFSSAGLYGGASVYSRSTDPGQPQKLFLAADPGR